VLDLLSSDFDLKIVLIILILNTDTINETVSYHMILNTTIHTVLLHGLYYIILTNNTAYFKTNDEASCKNKRHCH